MISICTVTVDIIEDEVIDIFLESIQETTTLVSEIVIVNVDAKVNKVEEFNFGNIKIKRLSFPIIRIDLLFKELLYTEKNVTPGWICTAAGNQHSLGLHEAINAASNEYVWLSDPDVFFYKNLDAFYLDLMNEHHLDIVGMSHHDSVSYASRFFCNHVNYIVKKSLLPGDDFLKGDLFIRSSYNDEIFDIPIDVTGKWLLPGRITKYKDEFPNPSGNFETGCNLWLWAKWNDWKWLAFQTADCHVYTNKYYKGNVKLGKYRMERLLYHGRASVSSAESRNKFRTEYNNLKEEM